jgi:hypothetical protein
LAPQFRRSVAQQRTPVHALPGQSEFQAGDDLSALAFDCLGGHWASDQTPRASAAVHPEACLRGALSVQSGPAALAADAMADLACLPEARFFGEETIANPADPADICAEADEPGGASASNMPMSPGYVVTARGSLVGRHGGAGWLGEPGGQSVRLRMMADLWCADGQVRDGWILRDTSGALAQSGGPAPHIWARNRINAIGGPDFCPPPLTPDTDIDGPYAGRGRSSAHADALTDRVRAIAAGDFAAMIREDDPACTHVLPGGARVLGAHAAVGFWAGLRSALPSAVFRLEHRNADSAAGQAPRAAIRWSLYGRHDGPGRFGPATGVYLHVMGMTHVEYGPRGVRRDWTLIDDCAVWTQILLATGDT